MKCAKKWCESKSFKKISSKRRVREKENKGWFHREVEQGTVYKCNKCGIEFTVYGKD